jgi:hypothetical protein
VLDTFLSAASQWADYIVVADQLSTDGSREIAARHPKVVLVDNPDSEFDEQSRQRLLLRAARELTDRPRVLMALDADEILTSTALAADSWERVVSAPPGAALRWRWANVLPERTRVWVPPPPLIFGFVDDGRAHSGPPIHAVRVPIAPDASRVDFDESFVLHLPYLDWAGQKRKQAWYQCWETLHDPAKRARVLYREYHQLEAIPAQTIRPFDPAWVVGYERAGIDVLPSLSEAGSWRDRQVLDWLAEHGPKRFAKLEIWSIDWTAIARVHRHQLAKDGVEDPRTLLQRAIFGWLRLTQRYSDTRLLRQLDRGLRLLGW